MVNFQALYLPVSKLNCLHGILGDLSTRNLIVLLFLLAALCGSRGVLIARFRFRYGPSLIHGTNMGKVELQDDVYSINALLYMV